MALDDLAPDQRAVLALLLRQGKGYDEIAGMLRLDPAAVRDRALGALEALEPARAGLGAAERGQVGDFLLGQQGASARQASRALLEGSAGARSWARAVAGELRPMAGDALPDIPAEGAEVEEAFGALEARESRRAEAKRSSRVGGVVLLVALGLVAAAIIILLAGSGGDSGGGTSGAGTSSNLATTPPRTTPTTTTAQPSVIGQANLTAPGGPSGRLGVARILAQGAQRAIAFEAQGLAPSTKRLAYALWVTGGPGGAALLGYPQTPVGANGRMTFVGTPQTDPSRYTTLLLTREDATATQTPTSPGAVVLRGRIVLARH